MAVLEFNIDSDIDKILNEQLNKKNLKYIRRGDIYMADLSPVSGSEQGGCRPVLVLQNNLGNYHAPTIIAAPLSSEIKKMRLTTHVLIDTQSAIGLERDSFVMLEQIRVIDKKERLEMKISSVSEQKMNEVNHALKTSLALD